MIVSASDSELVHFVFDDSYLFTILVSSNWTCPKLQVKLDASFVEAFLVATAGDTSTVLPLNSDESDLEVKSTIHGTVQLTKLDRSGAVQ